MQNFNNKLAAFRANTWRVPCSSQVNSGRRDSALLVEHIQLAWQQQMEVPRKQVGDTP